MGQPFMMWNRGWIWKEFSGFFMTIDINDAEEEQTFLTQKEALTLTGLMGD